MIIWEQVPPLIIQEKELQRTNKDTSDDMQKVKTEIAKNQERIDYAQKNDA
jgi:hypothetical protein